MFKIDKPLCFANVKAHECNNSICRFCPFHNECCIEIQEGRGIIKNNKKKRKDFYQINSNGKIIDL